jgi:hypothetical protein
MGQADEHAVSNIGEVPDLDAMFGGDEMGQADENIDSDVNEDMLLELDALLNPAANMGGELDLQLQGDIDFDIAEGKGGNYVEADEVESDDMLAELDELLRKEVDVADKDDMSQDKFDNYKDMAGDPLDTDGSDMAEVPAGFNRSSTRSIIAVRRNTQFANNFNMALTGENKELDAIKMEHMKYAAGRAMEEKHRELAAKANLKTRLENKKRISARTTPEIGKSKEPVSDDRSAKADGAPNSPFLIQQHAASTAILEQEMLMKKQIARKKLLSRRTRKSPHDSIPEEGTEEENDMTTTELKVDAIDDSDDPYDFDDFIGEFRNAVQVAKSDSSDDDLEEVEDNDPLGRQLKDLDSSIQKSEVSVVAEEKESRESDSNGAYEDGKYEEEQLQDDREEIDDEAELEKLLNETNLTNNTSPYDKKKTMAGGDLKLDETMRLNMNKSYTEGEGKVSDEEKEVKEEGDVHQESDERYDVAESKHDLIDAAMTADKLPIHATTRSFEEKLDNKLDSKSPARNEETSIEEGAISIESKKDSSDSLALEIPDSKGIVGSPKNSASLMVTPQSTRRNALLKKVNNWSVEKESDEKNEIDDKLSPNPQSVSPVKFGGLSNSLGLGLLSEDGGDDDYGDMAWHQHANDLEIGDLDSASDTGDESVVAKKNISIDANDSIEYRAKAAIIDWGQFDYRNGDDDSLNQSLSRIGDSNNSVGEPQRFSEYENEDFELEEL